MNIENCGLIYEVVQGDDAFLFEEICFNSKEAKPGDIFVCLKGINFDAHTVLEEIATRGVAGIVIERDVPLPKDINVIKVESTRQALALLSAVRFDYPAKKMQMIGITGTKGKTTTTHMVKEMLQKSGEKVAMIGTNGIQIGDIHIPTVNTTPESYELHKIFSRCLEEGCSHVVMEVSSQAVMMDRTYGISFDIGVFTNISPDHIGEGEHADFAEYLLYKTKFFDQVKLALFNADDEHFREVYAQAKAEKKYTFGQVCEEENPDFYFENIRYVNEGSFVGIEFLANKTYDVRVGIPGTFNAYNAMVAVAIANIYGISKEIIDVALAHIYVNGRMEVVYSSDIFSVIVDYAHNAVSTESLIQTLRHYNPRRLVVVFGCGGNRSKDRRYAMGEIAGRLADFSIVTADNSRFEKTEDIIADIVSKLEPTGGAYIKIPDRREAIFYAIEHAKEGDMIAVIGKGHEDYQEIEGVRTHFLDREVVREACR